MTLYVLYCKRITLAATIGYLCHKSFCLFIYCCITKHLKLKSLKQQWLIFFSQFCGCSAGLTWTHSWLDVGVLRWLHPHVWGLSWDGCNAWGGWASLHVFFHLVLLYVKAKAFQRGKPQFASTYPASAGIKCANVPLPKLGKCPNPEWTLKGNK